ncbi:hypothetical protein EPI10_006041 [Gossypium australe]|uniref:Uncharacterized protein n=1 Tax=Gossypium australe TaxID=47621 RepID=A0A5B6WQ25_9ROSI|nr:hypothetical protein EPI10_006041 [Gossypium australe]
MLQGRSRQKHLVDAYSSSFYGKVTKSAVIKFNFNFKFKKKKEKRKKRKKLSKKILKDDWNL